MWNPHSEEAARSSLLLEYVTGVTHYVTVRQDIFLFIPKKSLFFFSDGVQRIFLLSEGKPAEMQIPH